MENFELNTNKVIIHSDKSKFDELYKYPTIKDLVLNNIAYFDYYQEGNLYYHITYADKSYRFPVPADDTGSGVLLPYDKAILFMRWIRKSIEDKTMAII